MTERLDVDLAAPAPRTAFWTVNAGQVAMIVAMLTFSGAIWNVVNTVETTLENHGQRISALERELNERHQENSNRLDAITHDIGGLARELSVIQGQLLQQPRRGN